MKKIIILSFIFSISIFSSCTFEVVEKASPVAEVDDNGTGTSRSEGISDETLNSIAVDAGEIGIAIDSRKLAILGYKPVSVSFSIDGTLSNFSQTGIPIDPFTNVAIFKLQRKDLNEEQLNKFSEGVPIEVSILDSKNEILEDFSNSKYIINGTNRTIKIKTVKARVLPPLKINPNVSYYLNHESSSGIQYVGRKSGDFDEMSDALQMTEDVYPNDSSNKYSKIQKFYFIEVEDNIYAIKTAYENSYLEITSDKELGYNKENTDNNSNFILQDKHKFTLEQTAQGTIKILPLGGGQLELNNGSLLPLNFIASNITWEFDDLGTEYSAAIIPPAQMDFAFDQTIHNCSGAIGEYYVGTNREETKTTSLGIEESANFYSSTTDSKEATVKAEASGTIFGIGVSVSASGTLATSSTTAFGTEKGSSQEVTISETQTVSVNRKITVPPYTSVEVFDVIQKFENVRIPFIQRTLVRGTDDQGIPLSGLEIQSQLGANRFGGVVLEVGPDYIEYSVRGMVNVANYFEFKNNVDDIEGVCD